MVVAYLGEYGLWNCDVEAVLVGYIASLACFRDCYARRLAIVE